MPTKGVDKDKAAKFSETPLTTAILHQSILLQVQIIIPLINAKSSLGMVSELEEEE